MFSLTIELKYKNMTLKNSESIYKLKLFYENATIYILNFFICGYVVFHLTCIIGIFFLNKLFKMGIISI